MVLQCENGEKEVWTYCQYPGNSWSQEAHDICVLIDSALQLEGCVPGANHLIPEVLNFVWKIRVLGALWPLPSSLSLCNNNHLCLCIHIHTHKPYAFTKNNNNKTNMHSGCYNFVLVSLYYFLIFLLSVHVIMEKLILY